MFVLFCRILAGAIEVSNTSIIIFCVEHSTRYIHGLLFYKVGCGSRDFSIFFF